MLGWLIKWFSERRRFILVVMFLDLIGFSLLFCCEFFSSLTCPSPSLWGMGRWFKFSRHSPWFEFRIYLLILFCFVFFLTYTMLDLNRLRNCAFVDFKSEALAIQAHRQLNGYLFFVLDKVVYFFCNSSCSICSNSIIMLFFFRILFNV